MQERENKEMAKQVIVINTSIRSLRQTIERLSEGIFKIDYCGISNAKTDCQSDRMQEEGINSLTCKAVSVGGGVYRIPSLNKFPHVKYYWPKWIVWQVTPQRILDKIRYHLRFFFFWVNKVFQHTITEINPRGYQIHLKG